VSIDPHALPRVAESVLRIDAEGRAEKAEVIFAPGPTVLAKVGESLLRVAQANQVPLNSGCRMGLCGADPVRVLLGGENLSPPSRAELATLRRFGLPAGCRMACAARIRGPVTVATAVERDATPEPAIRPTGAVSVTLGVPSDVQRVVVIGNGIAGVTAAVTLREHDPDAEVTILSAEPYDFYNRMIINELVMESTAIQELYLMPRDWAQSRRIRYYRGVAASSINRVAREVITEDGEAIRYDRLILSTGAHAFVPSIERFGIGGSFVLRTIDDAVQLQQHHVRRRRCRTAVIVGAGLLGLEAGHSITQMGVRVLVLDRAPWPLSCQLDQSGGALLWQMMSDLGIKILPQMQARRLLGSEWVEGVELSNGQCLKADLCLIAAGIKPDTALAESAGLAVNRGVVVDDRMMTSDPAIFAAGDVAECAGQVYGLWSAGVEQAHVAAVNLLGGDYRYRATAPPTKLKVAGIDLLSVGAINATDEDGFEIRADDGNARQYRKLVIQAGKLRGAILIGHPDLYELVSEAVKMNLDVSLSLPALAQGDWSILSRSLPGEW
jgi:NAD(P)H-nitrite reductase large subunit/ferredoxin